MAVLPSANLLGANLLGSNLLGANLLGANRAQLIPNAIPSSRIFTTEPRKPIIQNLRSILFRVCCSNLKENTVEALSKDVIRMDTELSEGAQWVILKPWDVPWDWKVTTIVMMPYIMSIFLTGIAESPRQQGSPGSYMEDMLVQLNSTDKLAIKIFTDQLLKSVAKLLVLYIFVRPHQPFPEDIFLLDWGSPFNAKNGWFLWAIGGLSIASLLAFSVKVLISGLYAAHAENGTESLLRLLPMIGTSNFSTICLLGTVGILAPVCEELLYRGFLLASLTKWLPMTFSVAASSTLFTLAHQSPGKFLEIFVFGTVLGLIYAKTRNLLAPITMHALWNCGVILFLTFLHAHGYDMHKYFF